MKDTFNRLYKQGFSDIAIANHLGISTISIKEIKKSRPIIYTHIFKNTKKRLILNRLKKLQKYINKYIKNRD